VARKERSPREIVLDCCEGSRHSSSFEGFSDDAFIGYQTAMTKVLNPNMNIDMKDLFALIKQMLEDGEI
jgi:hypothetical protein